MVKTFLQKKYTKYLLLIIVTLLGATSHIVYARVTVPNTAISIDGTTPGRTFDGVGGLSGGGGTSRLLFDYPAQQQKEILDYLFKPNYGANIQILKVEIGADTNSTDGSEPSHMRTRTDENYNRGYEWWLMEQAKARNPDIKLYGLEWGAPGWFQISPDIDTHDAFWSHDNITYILKWLQHAQSDHNLHIDYIGGGNERGYNKIWYEDLKNALKSNNLTTQVVAAEATGAHTWDVATDMKNDANFNAAIDVIGAHYPCGYLGTYNKCYGSLTAQSLNKPLWASENGSESYDDGAPALARALNRGYIDARLTGYINWTLISSWYYTLPYGGAGLMRADQPWSGSYQVGKSIWSIAHTTQFTQPGWHYIDNASGFLAGNRNNGSYVTLKSSNNSDYSTIIETMDATASQTINVALSNGISTAKVHVWASNLNSTNPNDYFVHQTDITPNNGTYSLTLQPGYIYSLTTTTGQGKGTTTPPPAHTLSLPYTDTFATYGSGQLAKYFSDINGAFETASCTGSRNGNCLRQVISHAPIPWGGSPIPTSALTLIGDSTWTDYQVSVDAQLEQAGSVELVGRVNAVERINGAVAGYHLNITDAGNWRLYSEDINHNDITLASGTRSFGLNTWHKLALQFQGNTIEAMIDGASLTTANDTTTSAGQIALTVSKWQNAQFDTLSILPLSGAATIDDAVQGNGNNQFAYVGTGWYHCTADCNDVTLYNGSNSWDNTFNDRVTISFTGTQFQFSGIVDPQHGIGAISIDGGQETLIDFYSPTRAGNQLLWQSPTLPMGLHTFTLRVTGTKNANSTNTYIAVDQVGIHVNFPSTAHYQIINQNSGKALDDLNDDTSNGAAVGQWPYNGGANQQWSILSANNGYYTIVNQNSGKLLDDRGNANYDGAPVGQWIATGGINQQWSLKAIGDGYYEFVNRNSGKVLDVLSASTADGAPVAQWSENGNSNQHWFITQTSA